MLRQRAISIGKVLLTFVAFGLVLSFSLSAMSADPARTGLRLHVIPHSNDAGDQAEKLLIRDEILPFIWSVMPDAPLEQQKISIATHQGEIIRIGNEVLSRHGSQHQIKLVIGPAYFPEKSLGHLVYPAGTYEAVQVLIGDGAGENWWCVLFPPLCFIEEPAASAAEPDSSNVTDIDENHPVTNDKVTFEFRFWSAIVESAYAERMREWWQVSFGDE